MENLHPDRIEFFLFYFCRFTLNGPRVELGYRKKNKVGLELRNVHELSVLWG